MPRVLTTNEAGFELTAHVVACFFRLYVTENYPKKVKAVYDRTWYELQGRLPLEQHATWRNTVNNLYRERYKKY